MIKARRELVRQSKTTSSRQEVRLCVTDHSFVRPAVRACLAANMRTTLKHEHARASTCSATKPKSGTVLRSHVYPATIACHQILDLSRQRAKLYGVESKAANCIEGLPCI